MIIDRILLLKINFVENFGVLLIFLSTFFEAFPVLGLVIPGALISFIGGFFSKVGLLSFGPVLFASILGAILGDTAGYLLGRYLKKEFLHKYRKYFLITGEHVEKTGEIVHRHTGKALIIGRLNPVTRVFAPFIAGTHKVKLSKFMFFNIIGGILYGFLFVSLGYIFGYSYKFAARFERWMVIITVLIILYFYINYFMGLIIKKINGRKR